MALSLAGSSDTTLENEGAGRSVVRTDWLIYSVLAVGLALGAGVSAWIYTRRHQTGLAAHQSPLERAESLIASCETKLDGLEQALRDLQDSR